MLFFLYHEINYLFTILFTYIPETWWVLRICASTCSQGLGPVQNLRVFRGPMTWVSKWWKTRWWWCNSSSFVKKIKNNNSFLFRVTIFSFCLLICKVTSFSWFGIIFKSEFLLHQHKFKERDFRISVGRTLFFLNKNYWSHIWGFVWLNNEGIFILKNEEKYVHTEQFLEDRGKVRNIPRSYQFRYHYNRNKGPLF